MKAIKKVITEFGKDKDCMMLITYAVSIAIGLILFSTLRC